MRRIARWFSGLLRWVATLGVVAVTAFAVLLIWQYYVAAPWTRDGRVRALVANVAAQVSGQITEMRIVDNQIVHKGDVLYVINLQVHGAISGAPLSELIARITVYPIFVASASVKRRAIALSDPKCAMRRLLH